MTEASMRDPLLAIVDRLHQRGVPVVIIGGHAVNFHGYIRATEDLDLVFRRDEQTEKVVFNTLAEFGAYWIGDEVDPSTGLEKTFPITLEYVRQHHLLMLGTVAGYLDLFDFLPGLGDASIDDFFQAAQVSQGRPFASLEWLKRLKMTSNRPQDRIDLQNLP
jgi:hypothetical protein